MSLKSGIYIITNVEQRNLVFLESRNDETPLYSYYRKEDPREHGQWRVIDRYNGQHSIQNVQFQRYANSGTRAGLDAFVEGRDTEQLWYIKECDEGKYTIATTDSGNYWMLPDNQLNTPVGLLDMPTDPKCWWTFTDPDIPVDDRVSHGAVLFELKMLPIVPFSPLRLDFVIIQEITENSVPNVTRTSGEICGALVSIKRQPDTLRVNVIEFEPLESSDIFFRRFTGYSTVENLCDAGNPDISWQSCRGSSLPEPAIRGLRTDATKVAILNLDITLLQQSGHAIVNLINSLAYQNITLILTPTLPNFYKSEVYQELRKISFEFQPFKQMGEFSDYLVDYNEKFALPRLIEYPKLREAIIRDMPHLTELLKGDDHAAQSSAIGALSRLAEHAYLHDMIRQAMPHILEVIMEVLKDEHHTAPSATVTALSRNTEHGELSKPGCKAADGSLKEELRDVEAIPRDSSGRTPLSWAAGSGYDEVVRLLLVLKGDIDAEDNNGQTPLSWAAEEGHDEVVKLLLEQNGVDVNSKSRSKDTPLMWAASKGHGGVVGLLLAHKDIDVNTKQNNGLTPISVAARAGHNEVVRLLLEKEGVDIDIEDEAGRTPLSHAAEEGHDKVVELLLAKNGVDANSQSKSNDTPLMWAAYKGHSRVVRLLLAQKDINVDAENDDGRTPLSLADDEGHSEVKDRLNERIRQRSGDRMGSQLL